MPRGLLHPQLGIRFQNIALDVSSGKVTNGVMIDGTMPGPTRCSIAGGPRSINWGSRWEADTSTPPKIYGRINDLLNLSPDVISQPVEHLVLLGGDGNDVFEIASDHPYSSIIVTGDGPDAGATADANGDQVLVRGVKRAETITVKPNPYIDSETYVTGTGAGARPASTISLSGVERMYYLGSRPRCLRSRQRWRTTRWWWIRARARTRCGWTAGGSRAGRR